MASSWAGRINPAHCIMLRRSALVHRTGGWLLVGLPLALLSFGALVSCAHGGQEVYRSAEFGGAGPAARIMTDADAAPEAVVAPELLATHGVMIVPDPDDLAIGSVPDRHHAVDLVSTQSAVIVASRDGEPVAIHNDADLLGRNGCAEIGLSPEGDTRLTMILPEPGEMTYSRFYLVGCAPGEATLEIVSEGERLRVYKFTVGGQ